MPIHFRTSEISQAGRERLSQKSVFSRDRGTIQNHRIPGLPGRYTSRCRRHRRSGPPVTTRPGPAPRGIASGPPKVGLDDSRSTIAIQSRVLRQFRDAGPMRFLTIAYGCYAENAYWYSSVYLRSAVDPINEKSATFSKSAAICWSRPRRLFRNFSSSTMTITWSKRLSMGALRSTIALSAPA